MMGRFELSHDGQGWALRDDERRAAIVAGPYTDLTTAEAIELRDLLLREFPVESQSQPQATDWPDPDEVRRWLDNVGTMYDWPRERSCMTVMVAAARAYLRMREEQPAEPALSIEQVIAACGGGKLWELTVYPLKKGVAARVKVGSGDYLYSPEDGCATPEAAIQALGKNAIAKLRERHAADAQKLKELGVEP